MLQLLANGPMSGQSFSRMLPDGETVRLGRATRDGWDVPWDLYISREHADVTLRDGRLHVACIEEATNPAYRDGQPSRDFYVEPGGKFRIGKTTFRLSQIDFVSPPEESIVAHAYDRLSLKTQQFQHADHRLEVLTELPTVISMADTDEQFGQGLVRLLLEGTPHAAAAAVVQWSEDPQQPAPERMFWDGRKGDGFRFRPSNRLIQAALSAGDTVLHIWGESDAEDGEQEFTVTANLDWAFCTPIEEEACRGWCLYITGKLSPGIRGADDLAGDVRFAELIAQTTGAIRRVQQLEQRQAGLRQFFSPAVMKTLHHDDGEVLLTPTERDITVLFCDIRGFSRQAEAARHDLTLLLQRTSDALGLMTRSIIRRNGVIADFQGDAALAFWGWPQQPDDGPLDACRAALEIQAELNRAREQPDHPLSGFRVGIGIAHGRAIAGKIGAPEQAKVGVLGPVVNMGARLESMTKQLGVSILLDEATTQFVHAAMPHEQGRCRRMGRVRPYGMDEPIGVGHLIPPLEIEPAITDPGIVDFEAAVDAVTAGDWQLALELLERVPGPDRAKDFLTIFIAQNNYDPPNTWDGVIALPRK